MEQKKLRAARLDKHWTLAYASEQLGVDLNTLSRWEHGKTRPRGYNLARLCEVYEKTVAELGLVEDDADAIESQNMAMPVAAPLQATSPNQADELEEPLEVIEDTFASTPPIIPPVSPILSTSLPLTPPARLPLRRSRRFRRMALLIALLVALLLVSGGVWYTLVQAPAPAPAHKQGQRQVASPGVAQSVTTLPAQGTPQGTGTSNPVSPGSTPAGGSTPVVPGSTPTRGNTPVPNATPTAMPTPKPTPTPEPDCLNGSASHLVFTSVLGLGNVSPHVVTLTNCGGSTENWFATVQTASGGDWLSVTQAVGIIAARGSENVEIQAATAGLQIGTYQGSVVFLMGSAQWTVTATFTIVQV